MTTKKEIDKILEKYDKVQVATICSHSALQIFSGAHEEGLRTLGLCKPNIKWVYESFPLAKPNSFIEVKEYKDVLSNGIQNRLREENAVIIPHGSFVEYVGAENILKSLEVPLFGNREVLLWESDRKKSIKWLKSAGIRTPTVFNKPEDIDRLVIVKFPGARGGRSYFLAKDKREFKKKIAEVKASTKDFSIQEYVIGTRFYPHYFYSPLTKKTELLGVDIRYESNIDGMIRVPQYMEDTETSFVVVGNIPVVFRESLLPRVLEMGESVVKASQRLFPPGINGPFCIETVLTDHLEFVAFEISARIVAGTNIYIQGSPYSQLIYKEPMSTGRRIAREIKSAAEKNLLHKIIY